MSTTAQTELPAVESRLITFAQAARFMEVHIRTLRRLVDAGKVPRPRRIGGAVRFDLIELHAWVDWGCPPAREWEAIWEAMRKRRTLADRATVRTGSQRP